MKNTNIKKLMDAQRYVATALVTLDGVTGKAEGLQNAKDALFEIYCVIRQEIKKRLEA